MLGPYGSDSKIAAVANADASAASDPSPERRPLLWFEILWAAVPMSLLFIGGAVGGAVGLVATFYSMKLFRSGGSTATKFGKVGLVTICAFVAWYVLSLVVVSALHWFLER